MYITSEWYLTWMEAKKNADWFQVIELRKKWISEG